MSAHRDNFRIMSAFEKTIPFSSDIYAVLWNEPIQKMRVFYPNIDGRTKKGYFTTRKTP